MYTNRRLLITYYALELFDETSPSTLIINSRAIISWLDRYIVCWSSFPISSYDVIVLIAPIIYIIINIVKELLIASLACLKK